MGKNSKSKKRKLRNSSDLDNSGQTMDSTFLVSAAKESMEDKNMSEINMNIILAKIAECQTQTIKEVTLAINKAESDTKLELEKVNSVLMDLQLENTRLRQAVESYEDRQEQLEEEIEALKHKIKSQEKRMNECEQYSRMNSIKIYGLPEGDGDGRESAEDTSENFRKMCRAKLGVLVDETDIDIAHRLGKKENGKHRSVLVKFVRREVKFRVLKQRSKLKGKGIIITDSLSPQNQKLLRDMKEMVGHYNAWSSEGQVFIKINNKVRKVDIHTTPEDIRTSVSFSLALPHSNSDPGDLSPHSRQLHPSDRRANLQWPTSTPQLRGFGRGGRGRSRGGWSPTAPSSQLRATLGSSAGQSQSQRTTSLYPQVCIRNADAIEELPSEPT